MPFYEYRVVGTDKIILKEQSIKDEPLKQIDGKDVVRLISKTSFILNGNGYYGTDY